MTTMKEMVSTETVVKHKKKILIAVGALVVILLGVSIVRPIAYQMRKEQETAYAFTSGAAECNGGTVELQQLYVDCDSSDGYCRPGGTGFVSGKLMMDDALEEYHRLRVKFCKFSGLICTGNYFDEEISFCDDLHFKNKTDSCPSKFGDVYQFARNFTFPEFSLDFPGTVGFNAYVTVDRGYIVCHAQFKSRHINSGASTAMGAILFFGTLGLGIFGARKRCIKVAGDEEEENSIDGSQELDDFSIRFERMNDASERMKESIFSQF